MALPASGTITLNDVNVELGLSGTAQIGMDDAAVRGLFGIASGEIEMSDGYGKASFDGTNWTAPQAVVGISNTHVHSSKASTTNYDEYASLTQTYQNAAYYIKANVSSNGTTWTTDTGSALIYNTSWGGNLQFRTGNSHTGSPVFHDGTYWWAIGGAGNNNAIQVLRRDSSSSWTNVNANAGDGYCYVAKYEAGVGYFAAHVYGDLAFSTNGTSWSHYEPAFPIAYGYSFPEEIYWDSGTSKWVLFYNRGAIYGSHQNSGWAPLTTSGGSSTNGSGALFDSGVHGATTNGSGTWLVCGAAAGTYQPTIWKSTGGYLNWSVALSLNSTNDGSLVDIEYGADDGVYLAVTTKNKVYSSTDGTSWSHIATTPSNKRFLWYGGKPLSVVGSTWMLRDFDGLLQVSNNAGVTWTQVGPNTSADYHPPALNKITKSEVVITNTSNQLIKSPS